MPDPIACLLAVLAAAAASAVGVLALGLPRPPASGSRINRASAVGILAGLVAGYAVLQFEPAWPPASAVDRFLTIVLPATICVELAATLPHLPHWPAALLRIGLALATSRILLHGSVYLKGALWQFVVTLTLAGALLAAVWGLLLWFNRRAAGVSIPLALSESLLCGGLAVMLNGYIAGGEAALPPAAALAGTALFLAAIGQRESATATIGLGVVTLFALLFIGRFFGALPTWQALSVFLAPLLCWTTELGMLKLRRPWQAVGLRLGLVAVPLVVVLVFAKRDFDRKMTPMLTYLEKLMVRLAQGAALLPDDLRARQAMYLKSSHRDDGGFAGREGESDLYYTAFGLRGLALLGELDGEPAERAAAYLRWQLSGQKPLVDFISLLFAGALMQTSAGIDIFVDSSPDWRRPVAELFERFRRPDGGYAKTDEGQSSSTYHTFLVVIAQQVLGSQPVDPERLIEFVRSRRRDDGGFVEIGPMRKSGTNPTAAAAGLLTIIDAFDDEMRNGGVDFLSDMQTDEGGLKANTRIPLADLLSTFTGALTLTDLGAIDEIDRDAARRYVTSLEATSGGFRGGIWDEAADVEYTFYGLGALALLPRSLGQGRGEGGSS
jgi:geranylgeranyl transferase type-2 subunit beta